jgi:anthranilate phosphoribosyltransferase
LKQIKQGTKEREGERKMQEIKAYIKKLEEGCDLSSEEAEAALGEILSTAEDEEIGAFLLALKAKGKSRRKLSVL